MNVIPPKPRKGQTTYAARFHGEIVDYRQSARTYAYAVVVDDDGTDGPHGAGHPGVWGWSSRYDLAAKAADTASRCYRVVEIVPVEAVSR